MRQIASFLEFLRTGRLGPLSTDCTPAQVARLLGVPGGYIVHDYRNWPTYWCYGDHVEISFLDERGKMDWFQIDRASSLEGEFFLVSENLAVTLDGFSGEMRPSSFLRHLSAHGLESYIEPKLRKDEENCYLLDFWIVIPPTVNVCWNFDEDLDEVLKRVTAHCAQDKKPDPLSWIVSRLDPHLPTLHTIYSFSRSPVREVPKVDKNLIWLENVIYDGTRNGLKAEPCLDSEAYLAAIDIDKPE